MRLLISPPHLKYVAALFRNLSLIAFSGINVSQGSVATDARCDGSFNNHFAPDLPGNLPVNRFVRPYRNEFEFIRIAESKL